MQAMQSMYAWRGHFGQAALAAVAALWLSDEKYNDEQVRVAYVKHALGKGLPFMYAHWESLGSRVSLLLMFLVLYTLTFII